MSRLSLVLDPGAAPGPVPEARSSTTQRILSATDHARVRAAYKRRLDLGGVEPTLQAALRDTLDHPGSLLRAQLAYDVQRRHRVAPEPALDLAVAIEYFHSASLLFDDLPSMDDGAERRGRPCPHRVHGEAAAQLAALALITHAYTLLWRCFSGLPTESSRRAAELVGECLGVHGILDGQSRDLHPPAAWTGREVEHVAEGKTVTLIRLSLVLPARVAGAGEDDLAELESLARLWGLAYQALDDFKDHLLTADESGKTPRRDAAFRRPNLPTALGGDAAFVRLRGLLDRAAATVGRLEARAARNGVPRRWESLRSVHRILEADAANVAGRLDLPVCA